ncbi:TetR/AcrR family transcriptional regulator [Mycolicibacterium sp. 22603]|uniref:TetR/AcrR family transcriptional regulator n=1 Tax=Mycolicibacterium sp. 22603 TaxID=3453950 RepID=UPI003F84B83D
MSDQPEGLRARKKLRTRATLISTAADLCQRHGYDNTTVEQIAAAAEVSPRTFSRYFPTKDAVVIAIVEDTAAFIAAELAAMPRDITEYEAMLRAHLGALQPGPDGEQTPIFTRMAALIQIVNSSASLSLAAIPYREQKGRFPTVRAVAQRMGLSTDHDAVYLVLETWTVVMNTACHGLGTPGYPPIEPDVVAARIQAAYDLLVRTWRPWGSEALSAEVPEGEPRAGAT